MYVAIYKYLFVNLESIEKFFSFEFILKIWLYIFGAKTLVGQLRSHTQENICQEGVFWGSFK